MEICSKWYLLGCFRRSCQQVKAGDSSPLLSTTEKHLKGWVQSGLPSTRHMDRLESVQQRAAKLIKGSECATCEDRLRQLGLVIPEKKRLRGISSTGTNTGEQGELVKVEQWCSVTGQKIDGSN